MTKKLHQPCAGVQVKRQIEAARRANDQADKFHEMMGNGPVWTWRHDAQIRRAIDAIACGMASDCKASIAEGLATLQDLEAQLRTD